MKPARRKELVEWLKTAFHVSSSRACGVVGLRRSSYYRRSKGAPLNEVLTRRIKEIAAVRVRFGYRRICVLLKREYVSG